MKLNFILFCDKAELITKGGKTNLFGVFDTIYADRFPAIHEKMTIAVNIDKESGKHREFFLIKKDGSVVGKGEVLEFNGEKPRHQFLHTVSDIPLPKEGMYEVEIYIDDQLVGSASFFAQLTPSGYVT